VASLPAIKQPSVIPGFGLTLGYTLFVLSVIVLLPLFALFAKASGLGFSGFWQVLSDHRVQSALRVSFGVSFLAAIFASLFGFVIAWVLTRYSFPGHRLMDAVVDLFDYHRGTGGSGEQRRRN